MVLVSSPTGMPASQAAISPSQLSPRNTGSETLDNEPQDQPDAPQSAFELPPLDLDELSPLPPAQTASSAGPSKLDQASSWPPKSSSYRSSSSSPGFGQLDSSANPSNRAPQSPSAARPRPERPNLTVNVDNPKEGHAQSARYVTVSAILSRSSMYYPQDSTHRDILRSTAALSPGSMQEAQDSFLSNPDDPARSTQRRRSQRKRPSNGSAIEALGALLLRKDSSGKVARLSFEPDDAKQKHRPILQSWSSALNVLSKGKLEIKLPNGSVPCSNDKDEHTETIAERRARMWNRVLSRKGSVVEDQHNGFSKVKSRREGLSFEVSTTNRKRTPSTILDLDSYRQAQQRRGSDAGPSSGNGFPGLITLKADKRPHLKPRSMSEFGIGSSYHDHDLPEAPPSPIAMPGAWHGGSTWRSRPGEGYEEGALLLPPPLLDDYGSDAHSFEGLLGVRRMREMDKARKQAERLAARNRPTHKVGPLTALSNFVIAAHAAERSIKKAKGQQRNNRAPMFARSQTAPSGELSTMLDARDVLDSLPESVLTPQKNAAGDDSYAKSPIEAEAAGGKSPAVKSASPSHTPTRKLSLSSRASRSNSLDLGGRHLNTLFESEAFDPANIPDHELDSLPPLSSPLLRPSSQTSIASSLRDFPRGPRLLPVQLSIPPSPFTPLAVDYRRDPKPPAANDYLTARNITAPGTPQLAPTMLSLPPSPWTPYQDGSGPILHLHLNASNSSLRLPPGTPRLIPTHLEILPSPFPTAPSSRRGSLTRDASVPPAPGTRLAKGAGKPPASHLKENSSPAVMVRSQSLERYNDFVDRSSAEPQAEDSVAEQAQHDRPAAGQRSGSFRVTPATMLKSAKDDTPVSTPLPSLPASARMPQPTAEHGSSSLRRTSIDHSPVHVDASGRQRSFVLWFLIGDIGLRSNRKQADKTFVPAQEEYGGLIGAAVHLFGFVLFLAAHLIDLGYQMWEQVSLVLWFLRWTLLNLTGQTVLSQCMIEAYSFVQAEWATVAQEDHEEKGEKRSLAHPNARKPKGLTRWQVLRGLLELYCLHDVTRVQYLQEGAGLKRLNGWKRKDGRDGDKSLASGRLDIGSHRSASRIALDESTRQRRQEAAQSSDEDDGDSSDEEMIVTNRGHDILEFAKTPRLGPARPSQQRKESGYFGRAYDFMTSPQVGASNAGAGRQKPLPLQESNKDLVRTIKWCGRLAISAYGLHVHIVDLPPTFTPSGNRFSRQTFAYLSRLDADDVLHADIQTLDADADYSPTFYIVRDFVRKVVCVAVRGTQSFSDIIVDLELQTEEIELPQAQPRPGEEFRCHAGIWRAAKALVSPQSSLFAKLRQALEENEGFGIMFCGHSLGGAIASAAALILAEYFIPDGADPDTGAWVTNMSSGLPARRPIRAVSFASPVTMTADLAARAALGSVPLVMSVVLGSDVIPRVGHGQVRELRRVLGALARVRRRHELTAEGKDDARVHILRSYWDWRAIGKAAQADDVMLHRKERIEEQLWSLRREVESDLYAAVKARNEGDAHGRVPPSPWVGPEQRNQAPLHQLAARRQEVDSATLRSEAAQGGPLIPPGKCIWINDKDVYHVESPLSFFSLPDLRSDMFATHFPAAYEEAILALKT